MATIFCSKLHKKGKKMDFQPLPGKFGKKILNGISQEAWSKWLDHQTILINEYRLNLLEPRAKEFLLNEMEKFLFGKGSDKPESYSEPR